MEVHDRMSRMELDALSLALAQDGAVFYAVLDALPELVWTAHPDGSTAFVNRRWTEYTAESVNGSPSEYSAIHTDDRAAIIERWREAARSGAPFDAEHRLFCAQDGSYRWFHARAIPLLDDSGRIRVWIGIATDIDKQKRANENLNFVLEAANVFSSAINERQICKDFARLAVQRFADWCFIVVSDEFGRYGVSAVQHRDPEKVLTVESYVDRYPIEKEQHFTEFLQRNTPTLLERITDEMLVQAAKDEEHLQLLRDLTMHSGIIAPLRSDGQTIGAIIMYTAESRRTFNEADVDVLQMLTERAAAAIARQRVISAEQHAKSRLQFIGRATEKIYESLDLTATFGELARLIVSRYGDFVLVARVEGEHRVRVLAAAHRDLDKEDAARALVGVRPFLPDAEKKFIEGLRSHKTVVRRLDADIIARSTWPYLSNEMEELAPVSSVTIPLHSRGITYGAIVVYSANSAEKLAGDEIDILTEIGRHASVAMENAEVFERERRMAQTLQDSLLPPSLPCLQGVRFDAVYLPSASDALVGGDWYDAFVLEDGSVVVSAGDVTGRGPKAAVIMGKVRHLIAVAPSYERDPARIFDTVESVLIRRYPDAIVTAFLGIIDADRRLMRYANAGHPPPLMRRKDTIEELVVEGLPLGLRRNAEPSQSRVVSLNDARLLVLFTDGLVEATHDILAGYERLREVMQSDAVLHTHSPARFIEESCLKDRADDDVAVLTLSFESSVRWAFDAENARAGQDARNQFMRYLRANADNEEEIAMAELIFGELVGNVVRHSPGAIDIDLDWSDERPVLHVIDRGRPFERTKGLPDVLSESGRGLFIVGELSGNMRVEHVAGYGNHVVAELPVRRRGS
jgi:PAS domain S-box-containing protein